MIRTPNRSKNVLRLSCALAIACWSSSAFADEAETGETVVVNTDPPPAPTPRAPATAEQPMTPPATALRTDLWRIDAGYRTNYIRSKGFDPYSSNDVLPEVSLAALYPLLHRGKLALAVGAGYSGGAVSDKIRGDETSLTIHQLSAPIEGRYHFARWAFVFARVAPGATAAIASLKEASAPNDVTSTKWAFSTDVSAGTAFLIGPRGADLAEKRSVRFWAVPEVGYGFATRFASDARPDRAAKDALGTDERIAVSSLSTSSFFWRVSVATTF